MAEGPSEDRPSPEMRKRSLAELSDESAFIEAQKPLDDRMDFKGVRHGDAKKGKKGISGDGSRQIVKLLCPYCREQNELYYKFCWHCGRRIMS